MSGQGSARLVHWAVGLFTVLLIWLVPFLTGQNWLAEVVGVLVLGALYSLLVYNLILALLGTRLPQTWGYRLGLLLGILVAVLQASACWSGFNPLANSGFRNAVRPGGVLPSLVVFAMGSLGSLLGALLASSRETGLWENNSPPPEDVEAEVYRRHRELIGVPGKLPVSKRGMDVLVSSVGLLVSLPVWLLITLLIWLEDPGPVLFVKNSVGRGGLNFHQFKFRTMVRGAEQRTGPVLSEQDDERVLSFGRILRRTALDELPQLINILIGEMSFVGPRPQRTVLVRDYLVEIPEYAGRHAVPPGLAGLAQVAGSYYLTPRQKLRFDRLYIRHLSLGFDLKLGLLAFLITFVYRWKADWDGRLPRRLLH